MENSQESSNVTFRFNLELDDVASNATSDSETTGLQIDVSEVDNFNDTNKLRRQGVEDTSFINEMEEEIERQLDAKAAKTNLTATNVKNILKHVISNEHVMAMVHKRLNKDDFIFEPKLTRAKAKELAMAQPDIPWPLTPGKKNTSEVQILIQEEFSEDSSDEEYRPDQDQQSDDEKDVDNLVGSDLDSQPCTPATLSDTVTTLELQPNTLDTNVQYDEEGIFKIPQLIPHVPTEEESIGHRTRSKLCLSETPLEQIEQAFIPPDITTDMYDWEPEDEYIGFLKELYTQPLQKEVNVEDDPEADPEYNILEDEDKLLLDKEELREDKAVKISKKELKTLIAELDEFADQYTKQQQLEEEQQKQQQQKESKKKKTPNSSFSSLGNTSLVNPMVDLLPVLAEPELPEIVNSSQRHLLSVQISQHVQLMVQQFIMTYKHPKWDHLSKISKSNLHSLSTLSNTPNSKFIAANLFDALKLVHDWELKLNDEHFSQEYFEHLDTETKLEKQFFNQKRKYRLKFHPEMIKLMAESKALMHPELLPDTMPASITGNKSSSYLPSEENLIALGLEQFIPYIKSLSKKFAEDCHVLADAIKEIQKYLLPTKDYSSLRHHINNCKFSKKSNPIKQYFQTGSAPKVKHCVLKKYELISPRNQSKELLPALWRSFIDHLKCDDIEDFVLLSRPSIKETIKVNEDFFSTSYSEMIPHKDHELRNPIVNMLRNMPTLMTPQKDESSNASPKNTPIKIKVSQSKTNETESDAESAESQKMCETDEEESRPTRLRMTTPRLAKIKSAQNMKSITQTLPPKESTSNSNISEGNDDDTSSFSKGDNEDEIAELMLASTTIKKMPATRKKTKQARELDNLKRFLEAENNINEDERATKFAASFIQKIHVKLESKDPDLFKTMLKIFLDYSEKLENPNQILNEDCFSSETSPDYADSQTVKEFKLDKDKLSIDLYKEVCEKLREYPDLCSDFLLFLTPCQAALIDKSVEHTMMLKMKQFVNVTQLYFAKQPSRIAKVMQAMTQMASDPYITIENAQNIMGVALKGHPLIMDMFLQILPSGKPPDSLFAANMFENLTCPVGPHDKVKEYEADAPELFENVELPVSTPQEDPYGGDSCKCDCHSLTDDPKLKGMSEHCASCGTRFLNGRIYLQTSEGLRPAKITFPGADDEKLENISRVSLKTAEKFVPCPPPRKRRKSIKRDSLSEDSNAKSCSVKVSPVKDNEENDKSTSKPKRGSKSPSKTIDPKKLAKTQSSALKNKREKKTEKKENKSEQKTDDDQNEFCITTDQSEYEESTENNTNKDYMESDFFNNKFGEASTDSHEDDTIISPEKINVSSTSVEKLDESSNSSSSINEESDTPAENIPWTMQEDKILLENVQKDYSEKSFHKISLLLKNRTIEQVKERCEYLLHLIEKMA